MGGAQNTGSETVPFHVMRCLLTPVRATRVPSGVVTRVIS
jgi:hypothetical protein